MICVLAIGEDYQNVEYSRSMARRRVSRYIRAQFATQTWQRIEERFACDPAGELGPRAQSAGAGRGREARAAQPTKNTDADRYVVLFKRLRHSVDFL
jgi:hypothetical protein